MQKVKAPNSFTVQRSPAIVRVPPIFPSNGVPGSARVTKAAIDWMFSWKRAFPAPSSSSYAFAMLGSGLTILVPFFFSRSAFQITSGSVSDQLLVVDVFPKNFPVIVERDAILSPPEVERPVPVRSPP